MHYFLKVTAVQIILQGSRALCFLISALLVVTTCSGSGDGTIMASCLLNYQLMSQY